MESIRFSAKTLDDAITKACIELGATSEALGYEVLEAGSRGVLGIGARPCVIRAWKKDEIETEQPIKNTHDSERVQSQADKKAEGAEITEAAAAKAAFRQQEKPKKAEQQAVKKTELEQRNAASADVDANSHAQERKAAGKQTESSAEQTLQKATAVPVERKAVLNDETKAVMLDRAVHFLTSVFQSMGIDVNVEAGWDEEDGNTELALNLTGSDMGVLIGKRGQTLDALQYLTSQVVNKHQSGYLRVKLDTENYRERRRETLETLAKNIAYKVRRTRRPVALEPMNPYERRIIHSVLQAEKDITTRSEGEEPYRHVVICCVRKKK